MDWVGGSGKGGSEEGYLWVRMMMICDDATKNLRLQADFANPHQHPQSFHTPLHFPS